tara:strand:- start:1381 stop:1536 length:156 start_codon:yes stop_codon:yes gene_type:complete
MWINTEYNKEILRKAEKRHLDALGENALKILGIVKVEKSALDDVNIFNTSV